LENLIFFGGDGRIWQWNNVPKHTLRWASRFKVIAVLCALLAVGQRINQNVH
jgi:hypothetical protein